MLSFRKTETVTKAAKQKDMNMIMKKWAMAAFGVLFSLMFCFNCLGYAALSANLTIEGSATWTMPEIVLITNVTWDDAIDTKVFECTYMNSVLSSGVVLSSQSDSVTLDITVYNNTDVVQGLDAVLSEADFYSNPNITFSLTNLIRPKVKKITTNGVTTTETIPGTQIQPHTSHTFKITFSYKQTDSSISALDLESTLNFVFKPYDEIKPEEETFVIIEGALEQFKVILNTDAKHQQLIDEMTNNRTSTRGDANTLTYIGNVVGANSNDSTTLESLFNGQLTLNINGEKKPVTAMVKRKNIDGDTSTGSSYQYDETTGMLWWEQTETISVHGCEMTLYMTTDDLSKVSNPTVYAAVFTCRDGGEWEQIGDLYLGTATRNGYVYPHTGSDHSFNTDSWRSSEAYHNINSGSTIEQVIAAYKRSQATN